MKDGINGIAAIIKSFQESLQQNLPAMEDEIKELIQSKSTDKNSIENTLDILLSLIDFGVGKDLYIQLLEYYKTVDAQGADFYWNAYDTKNEE